PRNLLCRIYMESIAAREPLQLTPAVVVPDPVAPRTSFATMLQLGLILLIGLGVRAILSTADGYIADVRWFASWMSHVTNTGLPGIYDNSDVNYPPLFIYVLRLMGEVWKNVDPSFAHTGALFSFLRLPAVLADIGITLLLFTEVRRVAGPRWALGAATMYFFNPAVMYVTALWGQVDSIHTMFVLAALIATNRQRHAFAGFFAAVSLAQKLQSLAFLPLFLFEAYRIRSWRGLRDFLAGSVLAALVVMLPLAQTGTIEKAYQRGYKNVVGQYPKCSVEALNLWFLLGMQDAPDNVAPSPLIRLAAAGGPELPDDQTWYLALTVRKLSILAFGLVAMSMIAWLPFSSRADSRALVASLIGLAFFAILTEMHERYSFPVLGLMVLWAAYSPTRQAVYWVCSTVILLNLVYVLGTEQIKVILGGAPLLLLLGMALWLMFKPRFAANHFSFDFGRLMDPIVPRRWLVVVYQWVTVIAVITAAGTAGAIWFAGRRVPVPLPTDAVYLSDLKARQMRNGWREVALDHSVAGGPLLLSGHYFLKGLGTHAPATLEYDIPRNATFFQAVVEVNDNNPGRVICRVYVDNELAWESAELSRRDPANIDVFVGGSARLRLEVDPLQDKRHDHVDWGLAKFLLEPQESAHE
ncbi:MAG: NPCBM/NEW2 domain-containing protein, partial [Phycisphaerae bacterium]